MNLQLGDRLILGDKQAEIAFACGDTNLFVELMFENADSLSFPLVREDRHGRWEIDNNPFYKALTEIKRDFRRRGYKLKDQRTFYKLAII